MPKSLLYIFLVYFTVFAVQAGQTKKTSVKAKPTTISKMHLRDATKTGKIKILPNIDQLESKTISFKMKDQMITGDLCVYHEHVYDDHVYKDVVKGKFRLNNISDKKTLIQYHVMFKDKKGLLAKTSGHIHLASGLEQIVHLSSIPLHIKDIQNISDYEIKLIAK